MQLDAPELRHLPVNAVFAAHRELMSEREGAVRLRVRVLADAAILSLSLSLSIYI